MLYWLDIKAVNTRKGLRVLAICVLSEDGRKYYALNHDCDLRGVSTLFKSQCLSKLPKRPKKTGWKRFGGLRAKSRLRPESKWKSEELIALELLAFFKGFDHTQMWSYERSNRARFYDRLFRLTDGTFDDRYGKDGYISNMFHRLGPDKIEVWTEDSAEKYVAFCSLYGSQTYLELPVGFPFRFNDILQSAEEAHIALADLPHSLETSNHHDADLGTVTVKLRYDYIQGRKTLINHHRELRKHWRNPLNPLASLQDLDSIPHSSPASHIPAWSLYNQQSNQPESIPEFDDHTEIFSQEN